MLDAGEIIHVRDVNQLIKKLGNRTIHALVFGDVHCGAPHNKTGKLWRICTTIEKENPNYLPILQGDTYDNGNLELLSDHDVRFLAYVWKRVKEERAVVIHGNHDRRLLRLLHNFGQCPELPEHYCLEVCGRRFLIEHGDAHEDFTRRFPTQSDIGSALYNMARKLDGRKRRVSKKIKQKVKLFLKICEAVRDGAVTHARELGCQAVICGHTHHPEIHKDGDAWYYNAGHSLDEIGVVVITTAGECFLFVIEP